MNFICTYFYSESEDIKSTYANISKSSTEKNLIYWKTVYTFFYSSILNNPESKHVLFTNNSYFPYRKKLEEKGVLIFDDLSLSYPNVGKWASVKFFFDVIDFIVENEFFCTKDKFALFDTDCLSINSFSSIFDLVTDDEPIAAYLNGFSKNQDMSFHGVSISELNEIYETCCDKKININEKIGGEFFVFRKDKISAVKERYDNLLNSEFGEKLTTEEQILSMINCDIPFNLKHHGIYRIWSTLRHIDIPQTPYSYSFLHFPSEKEFSLDLLFREFIDNDGISTQSYRKLVKRITSLSSVNGLKVKRIFRILRNKVLQQW